MSYRTWGVKRFWQNAEARRNEDLEQFKKILKEQFTKEMREEIRRELEKEAIANSFRNYTVKLGRHIGPFDSSGTTILPRAGHQWVIARDNYYENNTIPNFMNDGEPEVDTVDFDE